MTKTYHSRMTSKGQITIPAELRKELGLKAGDRVEFIRENGSIQVRRVEPVVARFAGAFRDYGRPLDPDEIHEEAEKAIAEEYIRRSGYR